MSLVRRLKPKYIAYGLSVAGAAVVAFSIIFMYGTLNFQTILITGLLLTFTPVILVNYLDYMRVKAIELYLPDFLRDVAESHKSGMTLARAIESATHGAYGPLTEEMKLVSSQISWGIPIEDALQRFANRVKSKLVRQTILIINESYKSGGEIADILETVSIDIKTLKDLEIERKSKLRVYTISIYFIFFLFLGIILVLAKSFLPATPQLNNVATLIGGTVSKVSEEEFKTYFFHLCLIQAFFAGLISGQMGEGSITSGFKHSFILIIITLVTFQFVLAAEPIDSRFADEILRIPPNSYGVSSAETAFLAFSDATSTNIAALVQERATARKLNNWYNISASDISFRQEVCPACTRGDLIVGKGFLIVKKPTKILFKVSNRAGKYEITIKGT